MRRFALLLFLTLHVASVSYAQTFGEDRIPRPRSSTKFSFDFRKPTGAGGVKIEVAPGGRQEYVRDEYVILEGDVKITYGDVTIRADRIEYNFVTFDADAEGNVVIDQGPQRLSATSAIYNLQSETGTLLNAKAAMEPSLYFRGDTIEKLGEQTYRLTNGVFTSCDIEDPEWSFHVASGTITLDDYARLRNIAFRAGGIPLFWTPYIVWPTKEDRSRGLLIPKPGYNSDFGAYLKSAYFIPFGQSADATIQTDVFTKGLVGAGIEARYVPSREIKGELNGYILRDPGNDLPELGRRDEQIEWKYSYQHTQDNLPGGFRGVIDVRDFSDLQFFQRYERDFSLSTISNIYSSAYLTKNRPKYSLNIRADKREHFLGIQQNSDGTTTQPSRIFEQLPALEYRTYPNRIGKTPLYYSLESSASHLRTINDAGGSQELTSDYFRADISPTLTMQLRTPPWLSIKPEISLRQTWYSASLCDPATDSGCTGSPSQSGQIVDRSLDRFYAQGEVEIVGPSLSRIYSFDIGNFTRFKHVIEPRARYIYTTDVEDQGRVIRFDTVDAPFLPLVRDTVEYSLTQRIIGKEKGENANARDIMSLSIRQSVALSEPFDSVSTPDSQRRNRFSPLTLSAHINPYQTVTIDANASFGSESKQLDQATLSANLHGERGFLNLTWFSTFASEVNPFESSQVRFSTGAPLWKNRVRATTQMNYDFERSSILEQRYVLGFFASCYDIAVEFRDFQQFQSGRPDRGRDYQISISLKNVGTFLDFRGSLDGVF